MWGSSSSHKALALGPFELFFDLLNILHFLRDNYPIGELLVDLSLFLNRCAKAIHIPFLFTQYLWRATLVDVF
jgi:hypothetical protein